MDAGKTLSLISGVSPIVVGINRGYDNPPNFSEELRQHKRTALIACSDLQPIATVAEYFWLAL
jgi:hypothetical protein